MRSALIAILLSLVGFGCAATRSVTPSAALVVGTHVVRFSGDRVSKMVFKSDGTFREVTPGADVVFVDKESIPATYFRVPEPFESGKWRVVGRLIVLSDSRALSLEKQFVPLANGEFREATDTTEQKENSPNKASQSTTTTGLQR